MVCLLGIYGSSGFTGSVAHQPIVAAERKAIQSFRPSDCTTAFGRAEGFSRRGGSGTAESRALTMRGEGGGGPCVLRTPPMRDEAAHEWGTLMSLVREIRLWVGHPPVVRAAVSGG